MGAISQFLIAFGAVCGIAAWFLYQKSLVRFVQHLRTNHLTLWQQLDRPDSSSPPLQSLLNRGLRRYIWRRGYAESSDMFVKNQGALLRQRLLFCLFCLLCLIFGLLLWLVVHFASL